MHNQLPLILQPPEIATFDNYLVSDNQQLLFSLLDEEEKLVFLYPY